MKIVVIGGTGLIGSKLVARLTRNGHRAVAAAPATGVNTLTREGLAEALEGAAVVVDVSNSPSFESGAAMDFFTRSTGNLLAAERVAGVRHHVALSVVGTKWLLDSGYFRGKEAQEALIRASGIPYSIVHATQFFEFAGRIADSATQGDTIRVAPALVQPAAADDVAGALARIAISSPVGGVIEVAGPEEFRMDVWIHRWLDARGDGRKVMTDQSCRYFGAVLDERTLLPDLHPIMGPTRLADWLRREAAGRPARAPA